MKRSSNIELLRIIAMLLILILHANAMSNGLPTINDLSVPISSLTRLSIQTLANVAVNVFVLISGWWGIKFSLKGVGNILFQCLFYSILALLFVGIIDSDSVGVSSVMKLFHIGGTYWFVPAYLGLMILSPLLNCYVESAEQSLQKKILVAFFIYQFFYGWLFLDEAHFINGYSCFSFIGLYLLSRYIKVFNPKIWNLSVGSFLSIYLSISVISALVIFVSLYANETLSVIVRDKMLAYNNPLCIVSSVCVLLCFTKIDIGVNKYINWLSKSCFAIYLLHCNILILP